MSGQISTGWISCDKVLFGEEALGASVVASGEVDLGQPEGIFVVFLKKIRSDQYGHIHRVDTEGYRRKSESSIRVKARSLSPMKIAESYWCLFRAS